MFVRLNMCVMFVSVWGVCVFVQSLDLTKANWTLRVVADKSSAKSIEVAKDTDRMDQIQAIKKAWEMAEPGRCEKVTQKLWS